MELLDILDLVLELLDALLERAHLVLAGAAAGGAAPAPPAAPAAAPSPPAATPIPRSKSRPRRRTAHAHCRALPADLTTTLEGPHTFDRKEGRHLALIAGVLELLLERDHLVLERLARLLLRRRLRLRRRALIHLVPDQPVRVRRRDPRNLCRACHRLRRVLFRGLVRPRRHRSSEHIQVVFALRRWDRPALRRFHVCRSRCEALVAAQVVVGRREVLFRRRGERLLLGLRAIGCVSQSGAQNVLRLWPCRMHQPTRALKCMKQPQVSAAFVCARARKGHQELGPRARINIVLGFHIVARVDKLRQRLSRALHLTLGQVQLSLELDDRGLGIRELSVCVLEVHLGTAQLMSTYGNFDWLKGSRLPGA
eukprot:2356090-Rhodomonas_salina.1